MQPDYLFTILLDMIMTKPENFYVDKLGFWNLLDEHHRSETQDILF